MQQLMCGSHTGYKRQRGILQTPEERCGRN
nr:MAG TPA: hypothetical protein [Caudoviricetes sp.]